MIAVNENTHAGNEEFAESSPRLRESNPISTTAPWLLATKVAPPGRTLHYIDRPRLAERVERSGWPIVMLRAPGGFGKTTLLSEICRREKERGNLAAWLTLDEDDTADGVEMYLMYAFEAAGLHMDSVPDAAEYRMERLGQQIGNHGAPCLLAIDEVERLRGHAIEALDFFLHHAPRNLRIVLGLRDNPGLDLSSAVLDGRATVLGAEQLRFSKPDIAAYFSGALPRRELAGVVERTAGWPVAVCLYRSTRLDNEATGAIGKPPRVPAGNEGVAANWVGARLFRNVAQEDRDFLLDLAQFDWIDSAIVDDAMSRNDSGCRLAGLAALEGLLQPLGGATDAQRLHPLLKQYCNVERQREDPRRHRQLHRTIAEAMLKRGHLLPAVRHAGAAGDAELVGSILVRAGGLRLWLREGMRRLGAAERFLTQEVTDRFPRLALLRCRLLIHQSKLVEARALYEKVRTRTSDFVRDRSDGDDRALRAEATIIRTTLIGYGCLPYGDEIFDELIASLKDVKEDDVPDPATVACHAVLLFVAHYQRARFERAREFGAEAETQYALCDSQHGNYHMKLHSGIIAMAQGRSIDAQDYYISAARIAEQHFPRDPAMTLTARILMTELNLERNRMTLVQEQAPSVTAPARNAVAWLDIHVAAHAVAAEWRFESGGVEGALAAIQAARDAADSQGLASVVRHLLALRIGYLTAAGHVDEAHRAWLDAALPGDVQGLFDLDFQSWREMEAISCARIRLLIAAGEFSAARDLADGLFGVARERGLIRTLMRCFALSMVLEYRAGNADAARAQLVEYLSFLPRTDFARPMVRERSTSQVLLHRLLKADIEPNVRESAEYLLDQLAAGAGPATPQFSMRERDILESLARGRRDKEIARHLGLSVDGVRYHLKNIYRKTGASGRAEAVRQARSAGIVS